jgi:hypothetical protein
LPILQASACWELFHSAAAAAFADLAVKGRRGRSSSDHHKIVLAASNDPPRSGAGIGRFQAAKSRSRRFDHASSIRPDLHRAPAVIGKIEDPDVHRPLRRIE